jgi:DNA-binding NarL/FixJ family response regulator
VEAFERHHPDVTLLDLRMPEMEGVEAVRQIRARDPQAKLIVLTTYDTDEDITRALRAGAKAYVVKDIAADALIACIHDVLAGKTYIAPAAAAKLAEGVMRVQFTPRELSTLRLLAVGQSNKEIARTLGISERTVKTHLSHLFEKLGVTSRTEAVRIATRRGLVRLDKPETGPTELRIAGEVRIRFPMELLLEHNPPRQAWSDGTQDFDRQSDRETP